MRDWLSSRAMVPPQGVRVQGITEHSRLSAPAPAQQQQLEQQRARPLGRQLEPAWFWAIGQFYRDFAQVSDERAVELLRDYGLPATKWERGAAVAAH